MFSHRGELFVSQYVFYRQKNIPDMRTENYVTIRTYHDHILGELMVSALRDAGIQTFQFEGHRNILPNDIFELKVHEDDVDDALEIIENKELN
jgi:hypothetical protein